MRAASLPARGWCLVGALLFSATPALAQSVLPALPAPDTLDLQVQPGDTLIGIARRVLVEPSKWPLLARENGLGNGNQIGSLSVIRIPKALLRSESLPARVLTVSGSVRAADAPLVAGAALAEGDRLSTGADGSATVQLVDGSVLHLRAGSQLTVQESRRYPAVGVLRSSVKLEEGRVEIKSPRSSGGQPGFEVRTPQGVLGVRGTEFRVAAEGAARRTLGEVLDGAVQVGGARGGQRVGAGFGSVVDADGSVLPPVPLLDAPDLGRVPRLHEKVLLRVDFTPLAGARGYRAQIARDARFDEVLVDTTLATPPLRVPGLADGDYVLRLRASDERGLEGRAVDLPFKLKARPEPPLPVAPAAGARLVGRVDFRWSANPEARLYRLQVARDAAFTQPVVDRSDVTDTAWQLDGLAPGTYHWRVSSLRAADDPGPLGDAGAFEVLPTPPVAPPPRADVDDQRVSLAWAAQPGQQFDLQLARDAGFTQLLLAQRVAGPALAFDQPGAGRFYVRLRTIEADGYVGPYGSAQYFDVPPCLRTSDRACVRASGQAVLTLP